MLDAEVDVELKEYPLLGPIWVSESGDDMVVALGIIGAMVVVIGGAGSTEDVAGAECGNVAAIEEDDNAAGVVSTEDMAVEGIEDVGGGGGVLLDIELDESCDDMP